MAVGKAAAAAAGVCAAELLDKNVNGNMSDAASAKDTNPETRAL